MKLPKRTEFVAQGIDVSTVNFFDDSTRLRTFALGELAGLLEKHGFAVLESGVVESPFLDDEMLAAGIRARDGELNAYAVWSKLRFAHYVIGEAI